MLPNLPDFDFRWFFRHPQRVGRRSPCAPGGPHRPSPWSSGDAHDRLVPARGSRRASRSSATGRATCAPSPAWQAFDWLLRVVTLYWFLLAFGVKATSPTHSSCQVTAQPRDRLPVQSRRDRDRAGARRSTSSPARRRAALSLAFSVGMNVTIAIVNGRARADARSCSIAPHAPLPAAREADAAKARRSRSRLRPSTYAGPPAGHVVTAEPPRAVNAHA